MENITDEKLLQLLGPDFVKELDKYEQDPRFEDAISLLERFLQEVERRGVAMVILPGWLCDSPLNNLCGRLVTPEFYGSLSDVVEAHVLAVTWGRVEVGKRALIHSTSLPLYRTQVFVYDKKRWTCEQGQLEFPLDNPDLQTFRDGLHQHHPADRVFVDDARHWGYALNLIQND